MGREGSIIAVNDKPSNEEKARRTVAEIKEMGIDAEMFLTDVSNEEQVNQMVSNVIMRFGRIEILINNAGINRDGVLHRADKDEWDAVMAVNLTGPFLCTKAVLPLMRKQKYGRIVNIASVTGKIGISGTGYYGTAKTGLIGLTRIAAAENATKGITINAVAPGYVKTDLMMHYPEEILNGIIAKIPVGRFAEPEEIADVVVFLCSDSSSYITGAVLDVNGGFFI